MCDGIIKFEGRKKGPKVIGPRVGQRKGVTWCCMHRMVSHLRINVPPEAKWCLVFLFCCRVLGDIAKEFYWKTPCPGPFLQYNFDVTKGKSSLNGWKEQLPTSATTYWIELSMKKLGDKVAFTGKNTYLMRLWQIKSHPDIYIAFYSSQSTLKSCIWCLQQPRRISKVSLT